jgi:tetratricopeptide (TPR) repeat protein
MPQQKASRRDKLDTRPTTATMPSNFCSEGFDLDALPDHAGDGTEDVIYEVGGSATVEEKEKPTVEEEMKDVDPELSPTARSEELKAQGNEAFQNKNYLEAYDMYSLAIEACPGMKGDELLELRDKFDEEERDRLYERQRQRRQQPPAAGEKPHKDMDPPEKPREFQAPPHPHAKELSIYHCNRAACKLHLESYTDAARDCDIAILLRPDWSKAYARRSTAHEKLDHTDLALADAKKALELDPSNRSLRSNVARLQKIEDDRLEKLKEETMGKLKDLGNSILGNFGLSMDNFKAVQDPKTGSYSISFEQGK